MKNGVFLCAPFHSTANPPVGLAYLRSFLRTEGIDATICDLNIAARDAMKSRLRGSPVVAEMFQQARRVYLGEALCWSWLDPGGAVATWKRIDNCELPQLRAFWAEVGLHRLLDDQELLAFGTELQSWLTAAVVKIAEGDIDWVGLSLTVGNLAASFYAADVLRSRRPDLLLLAGGPHVSRRNAAGILQACKQIDAVVPAPAYRPLTTLLSGRRNLDTPIAGLFARRADGEITDGGPAVELQIEDLPFADWSDVNLARYAPSFDVSAAWGHPVEDRRTLPLQTSRGCSYSRCEFCHNVVDYPRLTMQSPARVAAEVDHHRRTLGITNFFFTDDEFNSSRRRVCQISRLLASLEAPVRFMAWMRIDRLDIEMLEDLYQGGCREIFFGVEAVDDELLGLMVKGYDADTALAGLRLVDRFAATHPDFRYHFNLIIDHPLETIASVERTLRAICAEPELFVGRVSALCRYHLYEGTPAFARFGASAVGCLAPVVPPGTTVDSFRYLTPAHDRPDRIERLQLWSVIESIASLGQSPTRRPTGIHIYD